MAALGALPRFTRDQRAYLAARFFVLGGLLLLWALDVLGTQSGDQAKAYLVATALSATVSVVMVAAVAIRPAVFDRALMLALPVDVLVVGLLTYAGAADDAFYPLCIFVPVMYALLLRKRVAWLAGGLTAIAYALGHAFAPPPSVPEFVVLALKTVSIPLISMIVAYSVDRQRQRESEAKKALAERDGANERLQQRVIELRTIAEITQVIHASIDVERVGGQVLDVLAKAIAVDECCLLVIDRETGQPVFSACAGGVGLPEAPDGRFSTLRFEAADGRACVPVLDDSRGAVLFCAAVEDVASLAEEDRLVLSAVASELATAVENSRLYRLTQRLAATDELTGLSNYRTLQERLDAEVERAQRFGHSVSLLMIDLDGFKDFNDSYGHRAGDVALADCARVFTENVRLIDLVARYGGEEFSVVLPETDAQGALVLAEKIRVAVSEAEFADGDGVRRCSLTASIGLATLPAHAEDKEALLKQADDALYNAKNGGRNRVRMAAAPLDQLTTGD